MCVSGTFSISARSMLRSRLRALAPGLTPRFVFDKFAGVQMIDVHIPTTDGRELILERYTEPERDLKLLLGELKLVLPEQPPPKITRLCPRPRDRPVVQTFATRLLGYQGLRFCQLPQSAKSG
jgi:hypothetical protein